MIYYYSIKSGSNGNCSLYKINNMIFLIDIGISIKYLINALENIQLNIFSINYIFLTHEHMDHIKGINTFIKHYKVPIYCSKTTAKKIIELYPNLKSFINIFKFNSTVYINNVFSIETFKLPHDSLTNTGYILKYKDYKLAHFTDLGFMPSIMIKEISTCNTIVLEANYDVNMLLYSKYPHILKTRIASVKGHLSNQQTLNIITKLLKENTKNIILSHLSEKNNSIDIINKNIIQTLKKQFFYKEFNIMIAPLNHMIYMTKII